MMKIMRMKTRKVMVAKAKKDEEEKEELRTD